MRTDIGFAGFALEWTNDFAQSYCAKLIEMGYYAKMLETGGLIVAYSPIPFSRSEAIERFECFEKEGKISPATE